MSVLIAHRGASVRFAENSLQAIAHARDLGADFIEIDVRLSLDGVVMVHHDADLQRSAADPRRICDATADDLRTVSLRFEGQPPFRMPTLREARDAAHPVPLCVEIKSDDDPRVDALTDQVVGEVNEDERVVVISFDDRATTRARARLPAERVGMIRNRDVSADAWKDGLHADVGLVVLSRKITSAAAIAALNASSRSVWVYALDDPQSVRTHLDWGADGIISNRPEVAGPVVEAWARLDSGGTSPRRTDS